MSRKVTRGRYGQGSITKQPNGRWKATYSAGRDDTGGRRRESRVFDTRKLADTWLTERRQQRNLGMKSVRERYTLETFTDRWITNEAPLAIRPDTANHYLYLFNRYVRERLGKKYLDELGPEDVAELLSSLLGSGLSHNTARRVRSVLSSICTRAVGGRLIAYNPVTMVKPPRQTTGKPSRVQAPLNVNEALKLIESVKGTSLEGIVAIALYMGLRQGEILGLQWVDINFEKRTLSVRRTLKEGSRYCPDGTGLTHARTNPPKTRNSERTLVIPDAVMAFLTKQRKHEVGLRLRAGEAWQATGFVFVNELGGALWASNVGKKFRSHLKSNGLRHVRFHDLRHSAATIALESGARLEEVSQALGHATIAITKDTYAPYVEALSHRAIGAIANALDGSSSVPIAVGQSQTGRFDRSPRWGGDS